MTAAAVLHDGRVWTVPAFVAFTRHPRNAGRVLTAFPLEPTRLTAIGHDGATLERIPHVPPGHIATNTGE